MILPDPPWPAYQHPGEFSRLWDLAAENGTRTVVEIGSLYGGTLWWFAQLPHIETLISVDLVLDYEPMRPGIEQARDEWPTRIAPLVPEFRAHHADSHSPDTVLRVQNQLAGRPVDLLFIDGDHTADGVRTDWVLWSPLVRPGGLIALHDTVPNPPRHEPGVVALAAEMRRQYPSIEIFYPDGGAGICVFVQ